MSGAPGSFGVRVYKEYFNFAASHFIIFPDGGREELHGHNYMVRVRVEGELGPGEMVLDFCRLKPIVRAACQELDHRTLLPARHPRLELAEEDGHISAAFLRQDGGRDRFLFPLKDVLVLPVPNTSTECLAELLAGQVIDRVRAEVPEARLTRFELEVEESPGQCGVYAREL